MPAQEVAVGDRSRLGEGQEPVHPLLGHVELHQARLQANTTQCSKVNKHQKEIKPCYSNPFNKITFPFEIIIAHIVSSTNPSNAEATFVQITRMQRFLKTI